MAIGVLIEALLGGPSVSTTSGGTSDGDGKGGGVMEWIKNKLKALSQLLGKLADKALASLPGIIGSTRFYYFRRYLGILIEHLSFVLHDQRLDLLYWFDLLIPNMYNLEPFRKVFGGLV